jgi:hypothetical protein
MFNSRSERVADLIAMKTIPAATHGMRTYAHLSRQQQWTIDMKSEFNQTPTYKEICQAIQKLVEEGLVVDSRLVL